MQTEAEIVQECADALADASGRAAGLARVSATWLDWTNTRQFVRARAVALPTPKPPHPTDDWEHRRWQYLRL